jgi:hypothetical protein
MNVAFPLPESVMWRISIEGCEFEALSKCLQATRSSYAIEVLTILGNGLNQVESVGNKLSIRVQCIHFQATKKKKAFTRFDES